MAETTESTAREHEFAEMQPGETGSQLLELADLDDVKLSVSVSLGESRMLVREILDLKVGSIVYLDKMAGELADISANGLPLAKGEIVVIGDALHVRLADINGVQEQSDEGDTVE